MCPTCGLRLKKRAGSCRLTLSIILLILVALIGGAFLLLAACAVGMSNNNRDAQQLNLWGSIFLGVLGLLFGWVVWEVVLLARKRKEP